MIAIATMRRTGRFLLIFSAAVLLVGCTNSKLIIGQLYNRLDDQMRDEFHKLAKWTPEQEAVFEDVAGTFHVWHRQSELPQYAALLDSIQSTVAKPGQATPETVRYWIDTAESFTQHARECHPINFSFDLMKTLTDKQVDFIEARFKRERAKNRKKYGSRTREERLERREKNIIKWAGRVGFDFNNTQKKMLRETLAKQVSLRKEYYVLSTDWNKRLFQLARNQQAPNYDQLMTEHLAKLWQLLESRYPEQWEQNRKMWRDFGVRFEASMTRDQRIKSSQWIAKMSRTLTAISRDKPSFKVGTDPSSGCLIDQAVNNHFSVPTKQQG